MKGESRSFNRIILIGNGFDLALGLKTSYQDFIIWYIKELFKGSIKSNKQIVQKNFKTKYKIFDDELASVYMSNHYNNYDDILSIIDSLDSYDSVLSIINVRKIFTLDIKSLLFKSIHNSSISGWVDIESIYYKLLTQYIDNNKAVIKLNNDLNFIKLKLEEYLNTINLNDVLSNDNRKLFVHQFYDGISTSDVIDAKTEEFISRESIYCLNFNYTSSLKKVIESVEIKGTIPFQVNHIHGLLNSVNEKIIFGFGDEMDKDYKNIENLNDNMYFEHIKSFNYFKNNNYRNLLSYLDSNDYQVCIYGHSCGLSDRVMLNEIFEHDNCKSIKIYFYENENGENDFTNKTMEISRHFNSNKLMRRKIVDFNPTNKIPQL